MERYENMDNFHERKHTLEVTLQLGEYKGTLKQQIGGNCFGLDILDCFDADTLDEDEKFLENNCNLTIKENDYGEMWFSCILTNDEGEPTKYEDELDELRKLVVKLEIVECEIVN